MMRMPPAGKRRYIAAAGIVLAVLGLAVFVMFPVRGPVDTRASHREAVGSVLPVPSLKGEASLEEALSQRRSVQEYSQDPVSLRDVSQLLWAAQGVMGMSGLRTAPSAGALYPLEVLLVAGNVEGLAPGVYRYVPAAHELRMIRRGDMRNEIAIAGLNQSALREAPATIAITGVCSRTTGKYGERGIRYVWMEAGHASQNIYLQAEALRLGTVAIGAFSDDQIRQVLYLADGEDPLSLMPVGHPAPMAKRG